MLLCSVYGIILRQPSRPVLTVGLVSPPPYAAVCARTAAARPGPEDGRGVPERVPRAPAIHLWLGSGWRISLGNEPLVWAAAVRSADGNKAAVFVGGGRDGKTTRRCLLHCTSGLHCPLPPQPQQPSLRICGGLAHSHMPRDPHPRNDLTAAGGPAPALAPCRCCITNCCGARAPPVPPTTSLLLLAALCSRRCQSSTL